MHEGVVLLPGQLLLFQEFLKIRILLQQGGYAVTDKFEVGMKFLLGGIELGAGRFRAAGGFLREGLNDLQHVQIKVACGLTGGFKAAERLFQRKVRIFRVCVQDLEGLDSKDAAI